MKNKVLGEIVGLFCITILADAWPLSRTQANEATAIVSANQAWAKRKTLRLKKELSIGTDDFDKENFVFGVIRDIEIDEEGCVYVLDGRNHRIQKYSREGAYLKTIGKGKGQGPGEFMRPMRMALGPNKSLYVGDQDKQQVILFDGDGNYSSSIPIEGSFGDIVVGDNGDFYITKYFNLGEYAITSYDITTGKAKNGFCPNMKEYFKSGDTPQLAVDKEGSVYCSLFYPYDIYKYSPGGKLQMRFSRKAKFKPPRMNEMGSLSLASSSLALTVFPDGKILNVIRHLSGTGPERKAIFYFDIFSKEGQWLLSFSATPLETNWVRIVKIDSEGKLYLDYSDPYPHVKRYAIEISDRQ
jgi:hypothetical protein